MHRPSSAMRSAARSGRPGFTLVELLAVILIIGLIAALLTPVIMQSLAKARNAAIKSEIDMLHMAIMNYKNEYGSFPPANDTIGGVSGNVNKHIQRIFPRVPNANLATATQIANVGVDTAIVIWLTGYTTNPTDPIANANPTLVRQKLFDFDQSRITGFQYAPSGKPSSPYLYINSAAYSSLPYDVVNTPLVFGAMRQSYAGDASPFTNVGAEANPWANPDTFQILCAGRDETFGTDDDLSNFWPGTRKEYLESLGN
jgi:prepilin-type N-terminal cleavage/methylation domain-containing protein